MQHYVEALLASIDQCGTAVRFGCICKIISAYSTSMEVFQYLGPSAGNLIIASYELVNDLNFRYLTHVFAVRQQD